MMNSINIIFREYCEMKVHHKVKVDHPKPDPEAGLAVRCRGGPELQADEGQDL